MLAIADFNQDGKPDVAVENFGSNDVTVLLGNGDGTFRKGAIADVGSGPGGIELGDFNSDAHADLLVANHMSHNVSLLLGRGDGTFSSASEERVGTRPVGMASGDFDRDGRLDFAVANFDSESISVVLNPSPRPHLRVALPLALPTGMNQSFLVTAMDAEGKPLRNFRGTIRFTSDDPLAEIPGSYTFQPADEGSHTFFGVAFATPGPRALEAHCDSPAITGGSVVQVAEAPPTQPE
jgi:hypothetical protein